MKALMMCMLVACWATTVNATPVPLQQPTATFSQSGFTITDVIDGNNGTGWALAGGLATSQTAAFETQPDVGGAGGASFTFTLIHAIAAKHNLGNFRLSVTTDPRPTFADGATAGGDVTATWTELIPLTALATNGQTLAIQGNNSILATGVNPSFSTYTITASTTVTGITGIRLEVLKNAALPVNGPGLESSNGNFALSEFTVDAVNLVPEPSSILLFSIGGIGMLLRRRQR